MQAGFAYIVNLKVNRSKAVYRLNSYEIAALSICFSLILCPLKPNAYKGIKANGLYEDMRFIMKLSYGYQTYFVFGNDEVLLFLYKKFTVSYQVL